MNPLINTALSRAYWLKQRALFSFFPERINQDVPQILNQSKPETGKKIGHVAMYTDGNAGDTLLPRTVRDVVDGDFSNHWKGIHAHRIVNQRLREEINQLDGLLIGGGGLFLRDTNPNNLSGWQWSCRTADLEKINVPFALFAVGYNRFRGQPDFKPVFRDNLKNLAEKSGYIGLRNSGSIRAIKSYLPEDLHGKVRYQPCPTTLCNHLYPTLCKTEKAKQEKPLIALNCAFDRINLRLGKNTETILSNLAEAMKELSHSFSIAYYAHAKSDHQMLSYLDKAGVPYSLENLYYIHPREVVKAYARPALVLGMRGHAQMIPFGCTTPILSLVSHDKIKWFLEDIRRQEWGVEMLAPNFKEQLIERSRKILEQRESIAADIRSIQLGLLETTQQNVADFVGLL